MAHSHHDHPGMDMPMCNMNMLFTWDTNNLCIVFSSWRITSTLTLLLSLVAVAALTAGYEAVREGTRRYEARLAEKVGSLPPHQEDERSSLLWSSGRSATAEEQKGKLVKAVLYGFQVFYSFFIMLLFMTYNGWIMIAVGVGATIGYMLFSGSGATKSAACH